MAEFEKQLRDWCQLQRDYMQKAVDQLGAGWTMRDPGGEDETEQFKSNLLEKIAELDVVIVDLEGRGQPPQITPLTSRRKKFDLIELEGDGPFELPLIEDVESSATPAESGRFVTLHCRVDGGKLLLVRLPRDCVQKVLGHLRS